MNQTTEGPKGRRLLASEALGEAAAALERAGRLLVREATLETGPAKRLAMQLAAKCAVIQNHVEDMGKTLEGETRS